MTLRLRQSARDRKATPLSLSPAGRGLSAAILRAKPRKSRGGKGEGANSMGKKEPPVTILGSAAKIPETPSEATLERVPNPHPDANYIARFTAPEFTCLCPVTGQPDFAHLVIDYAPKHWLVESKSLKLLPRLIPQPRGVPRGLHHRRRQAHRRAHRAPLPPHRRLLVSARRHADRRILADGDAARRHLAARPGRCALSRPRLARSGGSATATIFRYIRRLARDGRLR